MMKKWLLALLLSSGFCLPGCLVIEEDVHDDYDDDEIEYADDGVEVEIEH
jgi:hypothetical protein